MDDKLTPGVYPDDWAGRRLEVSLAVLGGINCIAVPMLFAISEFSLGRSAGDLWPAPGIYFLEIILLGLATAIAVSRNRASQPGRWSGLPWLSAGVLLAFVIMGIFSIGLYLLPAMLLFLAAGILSDRRQKGDWPTHSMVLLFAAMAQTIFVFLVATVLR